MNRGTAKAYEPEPPSDALKRKAGALDSADGAERGPAGRPSALKRKATDDAEDADAPPKKCSRHAALMLIGRRVMLVLNLQ